MMPLVKNWISGIFIPIFIVENDKKEKGVRKSNEMEKAKDKIFYGKRLSIERR